MNFVDLFVISLDEQHQALGSARAATPEERAIFEDEETRFVSIDFYLACPELGWRCSHSQYRGGIGGIAMRAPVPIGSYEKAEDIPDPRLRQLAAELVERYRS